MVEHRRRQRLGTATQPKAAIRQAHGTLEGAKTLPMTQDAKDAQIGRVTRELLQPRTDAGHVDQRLETMSGHLRHAFCEPQRLEVREGRLRTLLAGGAA